MIPVRPPVSEVVSAERLLAAWPGILERVATPEQAQGVRLFLRTNKVVPAGLEDGVLTLDCPTAMFQEQIRRRFAESLANAAAAELEVPVLSVACRVSGPASREHERQVQRAQALVKAQASADAPAGEIPPAGGDKAVPHLNGHSYKKELATFVVGSCNRLAYDAVMQVLEHPRQAPNPLFIHGPSGLGKTHLEQGLARAFKERYPKAKVVYLRCEQFFRDFTDAARNGQDAVRAFQVKMRHPDLLLIDDLHFLSKGEREGTKDELANTFDNLAEHGKRMVLTADAGPRDIQYLKERFVQRVSGGLVVELLRPDPAVRREVARTLAESNGLAMADEVIDYLADHLTDNIRELEGAVNRLAQFARSFGRRIDLTAARQTLSDLVQTREEPPEQVVLTAVAKHYGLRVEDIRGSRSRAGQRPLARHVVMYVLKSAGSSTYTDIGRSVGVSSHGSVAHACEHVAKLRSQDPTLDRLIADLLLRLRRG